MSEYDEGELAGQRVITLLADLGAGAELEHVLATGVTSIEEVESVLQQVWTRSSKSQRPAWKLPVRWSSNHLAKAATCCLCAFRTSPADVLFLRLMTEDCD